MCMTLNRGYCFCPGSLTTPLSTPSHAVCFLGWHTADSPGNLCRQCTVSPTKQRPAAHTCKHTGCHHVSRRCFRQPIFWYPEPHCESQGLISLGQSLARSFTRWPGFQQSTLKSPATQAPERLAALLMHACRISLAPPTPPPITLPPSANTHELPPPAAAAANAFSDSTRTHAQPHPASSYYAYSSHSGSASSTAAAVAAAAAEVAAAAAVAAAEVDAGQRDRASHELVIEVPGMEGVMDSWQFDLLSDVVNSVCVAHPPEVR